MVGGRGDFLIGSYLLECNIRESNSGNVSVVV